MRILLLLAACLLVGCKSPEKAKEKIGISVLSLRNPFFKTIADTFRTEAENGGYEVFVEDGDNDLEKQHQQVKSFLQRKTAAIVLCPTRANGLGETIAKANAAKVPVFTADLACLDTNCEIVAHIATDNQSGGRLAARAMIKALGDAGGKVAIIHFPDAESCQLRVRGFEQVIEEHNAKAERKIELIKPYRDGKGEREPGRQAAAALLDLNPQGIFAINDPSALGALVAVEEARKNRGLGLIHIVSFDGQKEGIDAIEAGKFYDEPMQFPEEIARKTYAAIRDYFAGKRPAPLQLIPTKLYRHPELQP